MKVVLKQDVRGQGRKGDLLEVSDGYARNYLFPRKLAEEATAGILTTIKIKDKAAADKSERERQEAIEAAERLKELTVVIKAKCGSSGRLFGAVTSQEIAEGLKAQHRITIDKRKIEMHEPIKQCGRHELKCKLGHEVAALLNVEVVEGGE